jgi:hypothetical protein
MLDLEHVSDRLFGRGLRLALAVWILELPDGTFYQHQAASLAGLHQSNVRDELHSRLIPLGMVQELPRMPGERRQYYVRTDSPLWQIIEAAVRAVSSREAEGHQQRVDGPT